MTVLKFEFVGQPLEQLLQKGVAVQQFQPEKPVHVPGDPAAQS